MVDTPRHTNQDGNLCDRCLKPIGSYHFFLSMRLHALGKKGGRGGWGEGTNCYPPDHFQRTGIRREKRGGEGGAMLLKADIQNRVQGTHYFVCGCVGRRFYSLRKAYCRVM